MKKILTYGTFDLLHTGHINILRKAKQLGDYLIVGITSENYDKNRGKLNVSRSLVQRIEDVKKTGLADEIIIEEYEGQKIHDILKYKIDIFVIGSDWLGQFDYLNEYCQVIYLERTKGISSTELRNGNNKIVKIGIIGSGRIASRFIIESKYVSGLDIVGVYNPNLLSATKFAQTHELSFSTDNIELFFKGIDAVYIASPHLTHLDYIKMSLEHKKHVLCEKPMVLSKKYAESCFNYAKKHDLILQEAIKTAYSPAFIHLISLLKSNVIGQIKSVDASFSKLIPVPSRELDPIQGGGSISELGSYTLLAIIKILGIDILDVKFYSHIKNDVDVFTIGIVQYSNAVGMFKVGLGVKTEGELIVSGSKGYVYVPAPWWKTEYFEIRYEDQNLNKKYFYKYEGDGLRYEMNYFINAIVAKSNSIYLNDKECITIATILEKYVTRNNVVYIK